MRRIVRKEGLAGLTRGLSINFVKVRAIARADRAPLSFFWRPGKERAARLIANEDSPDLVSAACRALLSQTPLGIAVSFTVYDLLKGVLKSGAPL